MASSPSSDTESVTSIESTSSDAWSVTTSISNASSRTSLDSPGAVLLAADVQAGLEVLLERMETLNEFMRENLVAMERIHAMSRVSLASLSTMPVGIERRQAQARVEDGHDARPDFLRRIVNGIGEKIGRLWA